MTRSLLLLIPLILLLAAPADARNTLNSGVRPRVLLLGDSNMYGHFGKLLRQTLQDAGFEVKRRAKAGSGLAFPGFFDWARKAPEWAQRHQADVVILIFGGNDGQSMKPEITDRWSRKIPWDSDEEWSEEYTRRVRRLARALTEGGRRLIVLSPTNRRPGKARERMRRIVRLQQDVIEGVANARWIDTYSLTSNNDGRYLGRGWDESGRWVRYRKRDGIHLTEAGAAALRNRLIPVLFDEGLRGYPNAISPQGPTEVTPR